MATTLDRIRRHPRVELVDTDEPAGPIVTLKRGWTFDPLCDNRVRGEDTATALLEAIRRSQPFAGPFED